MRKRSLLLGVLLLAGCSESQPSAEEWAAKTQAMAKATVRPLHKAPAYQPEEFVANPERVAFSLPKPLVKPVAPSVLRSCWQPEARSVRAPLEAYPLSRLNLLGVLKKGEHNTGLIQAPGGTLYSVKVGDRLGLDLGRVIKVESGQVWVVETLADGQGCWQQRRVKLVLNQGRN